jgi:formate/nitrite transporter FocA (FNT family)
LRETHRGHGHRNPHLQLNVVLSAIVGGINVALGLYAMAGGRAGSHMMLSGTVSIGIAVCYAPHLIGRLEKKSPEA